MGFDRQSWEERDQQEDTKNEEPEQRQENQEQVQNGARKITILREPSRGKSRHW